MSLNVTLSIPFGSYVTQYDLEMMCLCATSATSQVLQMSEKWIIRQKCEKCCVFTASVIICEALEQNQISYQLIQLRWWQTQQHTLTVVGYRSCPVQTLLQEPTNHGTDKEF